MRKLVSVFAALGLFAVAGLVTGCSSAKKVEDELPSTDVVEITEAAPADLGAVTSGRGL